MAEQSTMVAQIEASMTDVEGKYLTFTLADEEYGISIIKVKEIIGMMTITMVPQTPPHIKGVINLRGKVIPVIDLRSRFQIEERDYTERTCIIVVEVAGKTRTIPIGIVVDSVSEVLNIRAAEIEPAPSFGSSMDTEYILGMAKSANMVKILLDIDAVLSADEMSVLTVS